MNIKFITRITDDYNIFSVAIEAFSGIKSSDAPPHSHIVCLLSLIPLALGSVFKPKHTDCIVDRDIL